MSQPSHHQHEHGHGPAAADKPCTDPVCGMKLGADPAGTIYTCPMHP